MSRQSQERVQVARIHLRIGARHLEPHPLDVSTYDQIQTGMFSHACGEADDFYSPDYQQQWLRRHCRRPAPAPNFQELGDARAVG